MLPLKDDVPSATTPFVTVMLIVVNVVAFLYQLSLEMSGEPGGAGVARAFVTEFGVIPCRLANECVVPNEFPHPIVTIFTAMFLHGGLLHLGGNTLYLWIFGDNVEDTLGHARFLAFYLLSGMAAALAQTLMTPHSTVPMIGASGAISGVLGAYLLLFPRATVLTLVTFGFFFRLVRIPAVLVLGFWIIVQLLAGYLASRAGAFGAAEAGGVAWFAHIGGFIAGIILLFMMRRRRSSRL